MNKDKLRLRQSIWQEVNPCLEEGRAQDKLGAQKEAREAQSTPSRPQADLQAAVAHGGAACAGEGPGRSVATENGPALTCIRTLAPPLPGSDLGQTLFFSKTHFIGLSCQLNDEGCTVFSTRPDPQQDLS